TSSRWSATRSCSASTSALVTAYTTRRPSGERSAAAANCSWRTSSRPNADASMRAAICLSLPAQTSPGTRFQYSTRRGRSAPDGGPESGGEAGEALDQLGGPVEEEVGVQPGQVERQHLRRRAVRVDDAAARVDGLDQHVRWHAADHDRGGEEDRHPGLA